MSCKEDSMSSKYQEEVWNSPLNPFFNVFYEDGNYYSLNKESYYAKLFPDGTFSYDVSNNKVLANIDEFGSIKKVTFYRGCYLADDIPGVWVEKDFGEEGPFSFHIQICDGPIYDLKKGLGKTQSDLFDNIFPRVKMGTDKFSIMLTAFAPVSSDGKKRLSALVYCISIRNISNESIYGKISLPDMSPSTDDYFVIINTCGEEELTGKKEGIIDFSLAPSETFWTSYIIYAPGRIEDVKEIQNRGSLYWLNQTHEYIRTVLGRLSFQNDPMTGYLLERAVYQALSAIGMDQENKICGSNWGTFPATKQTWMKDMYYSMMPSSLLNPDFFLQGSLWFLKYGIRPEGSRYKGGIEHSVSNSLSSVIMLSLYYEFTGDADFFKKHLDVYDSCINILDATRKLKTDECWLIPSIWISDALSLGKYHTGTNICVWKAFSGFARIAGEAMGDFDRAKEYKEFSEHVQQDIEHYMTTDGPFGKQYLEGIGGIDKDTQKTIPVSRYKKKYIDQALVFLPDVIKGDQISLMMHDGEESDTTLIPFYGYKPYDYYVLRNYLKFSMSTYNPTYGVECRGIKWGNESGATFPGYSTAFSAVIDEDSMNGENGYLRELKRLADLDGSWWWWPYKCGTKNGDVNRLNNCGKCGWASGVFAMTMITQILGLKYDGPTCTLNFRPFSPSGNFKWEKARLGSALFDIAYSTDENKKQVSLTNLGINSVNINVEIISQNNPDYPFEEGEFLGQRTVKMKYLLNPNQTLTVTI